MSWGLDKRKISWHILFWICVFLFYTIQYGSYKDEYKMHAIYNLFNVPLYMLASYTFNYWQVPYFLHKRKFISFGVSVFITALIVVVSCRLCGIYYLDVLFPIEEDERVVTPFLTVSMFLGKMIRFYTPALVVYAYIAHKRQQKEHKRLQEIQQEKIETELKYLKAQLNPHFLFNTMNNLYSFVLMGSPKAGDMVLQLSAILDYVLYESQASLVPLDHEIKVVNDFVGLELTRYGDRLTVEINNNIGQEKLMIAPLILLSIVENAFKHGASGSISKPVIKINLSNKGKELICKVWNTKRSVEGALNDAFKEGIGLSNLKRQLNLIYPTKHELKILDKEDSYELILSINTL